MASLLSRVGSRSTLGSKEYKCTIRLLDDVETLSVDFKKHDTGQYLLDYVCDYLQLVEKDYFGLRLMDSNKHRYWLDLTKPIRRQVKVISNSSQLVFSFRVKFYPSDPAVIKEEITRYQLFLQLKRDLLHGRLYCPQNDAAYLGACILQDELGEYNPAEHLDGYVSEYKLLLRQTAKLEDKIASTHRSFGNIVPAEAELNFLKRAVEMETYGFDPYSVKDSKHGAVFLGLTFRGLLVYQANRKLHHLHWDEIEKVDYVGKDLIIFSKQHSAEDESLIKQKLVFVCPSGAFSKHLWKHALEQKAFFTINRSSEVKTQKAHRRIQSLFRGSTFRYNGRVYEEIKGRDLPLRAAPSFRRAHIERQSSRNERAPPWTVSKYATMPSRVPPAGMNDTSNGYGGPNYRHEVSVSRLDGPKHALHVNTDSPDISPVTSGMSSPTGNSLISGGQPSGFEPRVIHTTSYHSEMAPGPFDGANSSISDSNTSRNISPVKTDYGRPQLSSTLVKEELEGVDMKDGVGDDRGDYFRDPLPELVPPGTGFAETIHATVRALEAEAKRRGTDGVGESSDGDRKTANPSVPASATTPSALATSGEPNGKLYPRLASSGNSTDPSNSTDKPNLANHQTVVQSSSAPPARAGLCRRLFALLLTVILLAAVLVGLVVFVMDFPSPRLRGLVDQSPALDTFRHEYYSPGKAYILNGYDHGLEIVRHSGASGKAYFWQSYSRASAMFQGTQSYIATEWVGRMKSWVQNLKIWKKE